MIYDDPKHPQYGPVRRLHVMCLQLFGDRFPQVEARFQVSAQGTDWTEFMANRISQYGIPEATAQRDILRWFLSIHR